MKYAAAMKYGGELVSATECDYDSFKQLVPLCPNCKEPVYLRAGGDRVSSKGKPYKIGPHWCHFKGVSHEQVVSCESRVNGYLEKDKQRIAAKARGQRLKLLQRWFWSVTIDYVIKFNGGEVPKNPETHIAERIDAAKSSGQYFKRFDDAMFRALLYARKQNDLHEVAIATMQEAVSRGKAQGYSTLYGEKCLDYSSEIEQKLQNKILAEIAGFLSSRMNFRVRQDFSALCLSKHLLLGSVSAMETLLQTIPDMLEAVACLSFAHTVCFIPWASEFQRLEHESRQERAS